MSMSAIYPSTQMLAKNRPPAILGDPCENSHRWHESLQSGASIHGHLPLVSLAPLLHPK
jgi:hypothetical protein